MSTVYETIETLLPALSEAFAPTGMEESAALLIRNFVSKYAAEVTSDRLGSVIAKYPANCAGDIPVKKLMFITHLDEDSFMIRSHTKDGFLKIAPATLKEPRVLAGRDVEISGPTTHLGYIPANPIHLDGAEKMTDLYVDLGETDDESAAALAPVGALGTFHSDYVRFGTDNGRIKGKALSSRVGCAVLCAILEHLSKNDITLPFDVYFAFTARGLSNNGALPASVSHVVRPDAALLIGAAVEEVSAGCCGKDYTLGDGVIVPFADGRVLYDRRLTEQVAAAISHLPHKLLAEYHGVTNLSHVMRQADGIPSCALTFPIRYPNTASNVVDMGDISALADAVLAVLTTDFTKNKENV